MNSGFVQRGGFERPTRVFRAKVQENPGNLANIHGSAT